MIWSGALDAIVQAVLQARRDRAAGGIATENVVLHDRAQNLTAIVLKRKAVLTAKSASTALDALAAPDIADQLAMTPHNNLVLIKNRFNIMDVHLLLCAKEFVHQLQPLELGDMEVIQPLLQHQVLVAYNAGKLSGASQPRKHIQLIGLPFVSDPALCYFPLAEIVQREVSSPEKMDTPVGLSVFLGRLHGVIRFSQLPSANTLHKHYLELLKYCKVGEPILVNRHELDLEFERPRQTYGEDADSGECVQVYRRDYSLLLTSLFMFIGVRGTDKPFGIGCNSISYTGNLFVTSDDEERVVAEMGPFGVLSEGLEKDGVKK